MNKIYVCDANNYDSYSEVSCYPNLKVSFKGDNNSIFISSTFVIKGQMRIVCGENQKVVIKDRCWAESPVFYMQGNNNYLEIGEHTSIRNLSVLFGDEENLSCVIGKDCMFGGECVIRVSDAHTIYDIHSKEIINLPTGIKIGEHVWVAQSVFIAKNVSIPKNCVIGAHSVVTKKFIEENTIIAGIPAKIVKRNVNWNRKSISQFKQSYKTKEK